MRTLDETYGNIVAALLKYEVVFDRRKKSDSSPYTERRRGIFANKSGSIDTNEKPWLSSPKPSH